ncbi:hypothetical protein JCM11641_000412, partial [Rhodosporidiobolus odoratus]
RLGYILPDPSIYPNELRRQPSSLNPDLSPSNEDNAAASSSSESEDPLLTRSRKRINTVTLLPSTTSTMYQPGKAPLLLDDSPAGLTAFTRAARLFFRSKKITEDEDKIAYVGAGLASFQDLYQWYLLAAEEHEAKAYDAFLLELQKRALPRDYIWEARGRIRTAKQGDRDFEDWLEDMRAEHLSLTEKILPTRDFLESLLYGMDGELSSVLRQGSALRNSGLHRDDLERLAVSTTAIVYPPLIDYLAFDREARDEWSKIAARRRSNAAQLRSLSKKTTNLSLSSSTRNSPALACPSSAKASSSNSATTDNGTAKNGGGRTRPNKLTESGKDWLSANQGCFRCRKANVDHRAEGCTDWPATDYVVPVPPGWSKDNAAATSTTTTRVGIAAVQGFDEEEIDLPELLAQDSDSDSDAYALPPLSLLVGSRQSGLLTDALADSGSFVSLIADKLASRLGWSAGPTTLLIAPLEEPFGIILGTPFLRQHKISISFDHDVQLLIPQPAPLLPIDLYAEAEGPLTQRETLEELDDAERDEILDSAIVPIIARVEARTDEEKEMAERAARVMADYDDLFPNVLPALTLDYLKRTATRHKIKFVDSGKTHNMRGFNVPRKWRERWKKMLDEHLASGRLRPSTSPFASAAFIIPKKDPTSDPRWVNDYCVLNANTVKDRTPLPVPDVVLGDAALAKVWGKIDMTNAFFQTPMSDEDIAKTAIKTPWGLFEWTVMPQGLYFLGHIISREGLEADPSKVEKIKDWTTPTTVTQVRGFLGVVQYLRKFIPLLAEHTAVLTPLTRKGLTKIDHLWKDKEKAAFEAIKRIVTSLPVLRPIDQDSDEPIWLMTDASKVGIGAVLLQGKDWRTALPCGFYSRQYIAAEKNYPTHEQELLCVVAAMKAWRLDLLGSSFRQARWTEVLADYDFEISYIPELLKNLASSPGFSRGAEGLLLFEDSRIVVPKVHEVRETLLHDAHDALGHLGPRKTLSSLSQSFYWPGMSKDVLRYVSSCDGCQRFKARTTKRAGLLHALPVPLRPFEDVALDFVGPLPLSEGKDMLLTVTCWLTGYSRLLACRSKDGAKEIADLVYRGWFALFGLPKRLVSDRDKLFTSRFWRSLHERVGVKLQMSTSFHPETDGRSERTNKTAVQVLRQYVSRQQKDWVRYLSSVEYSMNTAVNVSTGSSPFEVVLGYKPSLRPPSSSTPSPLPAVKEVIAKRKSKIEEVRDALAASKVRQAEQANKRRGQDQGFKAGDLVMVDSADRRARYKTRGGDTRAAKLFPRWDGPYVVKTAFPDTSAYRLDLPSSDRSHPVFHSIKLKTYNHNDPLLHPNREPP